MSYSITAITDDYYDGTDCLVNKLNIRDKDQLAIIEAGITLAKMADLERSPLNLDFDFEHYKKSMSICLMIYTSGQERSERLIFLKKVRDLHRLKI